MNLDAECILLGTRCVFAPFLVPNEVLDAIDVINNYIANYYPFDNGCSKVPIIRLKFFSKCLSQVSVRVKYFIHLKFKFYNKATLVGEHFSFIMFKNSIPYKQ